MSVTTRINKLLANRGLFSRLEATAAINKGWVRLGGKVLASGDQVPLDAEVVVDPAAYAQQQKQVTILLNKPFSFVSQATEKDPRKRLAWQLLTFKNQEKGCLYRSKEPVKLKKLAVCGRLDADSEGMLILSQDGRVARHIIGSHDIAKEYMVDVEGPDLDSDRARLKIVQRLCGKDFMLEDRKLLPVEAKWAGPRTIFFRLHEGAFRQIRRMLEVVKLTVTKLQRIKVGGLALGALKPGFWRVLQPDDLRVLLGNTWEETRVIAPGASADDVEDNE